MISTKSRFLSHSLTSSKILTYRILRTICWSSRIILNRSSLIYLENRTEIIETFYLCRLWKYFENNFENQNRSSFRKTIKYKNKNSHFNRLFWLFMSVFAWNWLNSYIILYIIILWVRREEIGKWTMEYNFRFVG